MEKHPKHRTDGLGPRLKAARTHAGLTQDKAAVELGVKKATISSWETSRNIPDALMLGKLAQLYRQTADALLWDESISLDAVQIAVQFDALSERQQRAFKAMWLAYFTEAATDDAVERSYGLPKRETSTPGGHDQED